MDSDRELDLRMDIESCRRYVGVSWSSNSRFKRLKKVHEVTPLVHLVLARSRPTLPLLQLAPTIYAFTDCMSEWTLETASGAGLVLLLDQLVVYEPNDLIKDFYTMRFPFNIEIAAREGHVGLLHWW